MHKHTIGWRFGVLVLLMVGAQAGRAADTVAPTPPASIWATKLGKNSIYLSWYGAVDGDGGIIGETPTGVQSYRLYRNGTLVATIVQGPTAPTVPVTYVDTGLQPSTDYRYTIEALDGAGHVSALSQELLTNSIAGGGLLAPLTGLQAVEEANHDITLTWNAHPAPGVHYVIFRNSQTYIGTTLLPTFRDVGADQSPIDLTGMTHPPQISYTVYPVDGNNITASRNSPTSCWVTEATNTIPVPAPANVHVVSGTVNSCKLQWDPISTEFATYSISCTALGGLGQPQAISAIAGTSYLLTGLEPTLTYTIAVSAQGRNHIVTAASSITYTTSVDVANPGTAKLFLDRMNGRDIALTWLDAIDDGFIASYAIRRNGVQIGTSAMYPSVTSGFDDDLRNVPAIRPGSTVSYDVAATDAAGHVGPWSAPLTVTLPPDVTPPPAPILLTMTGRTRTTVTLGWTGVFDAEGTEKFTVLRAGRPVADVVIPANNYPNTQFTWSDAGLETANYTYSVEAVDWAGNRARCAVPITVSCSNDVEVPSTPTALQATAVAKASLTLSWAASADNQAIAGYDIMRDGLLIGFTTVTTLGDSQLIPGHAYVYQVKARDSSGNYSLPSAPLSVTTLVDTQVPTAPTVLTASSLTAVGVTLTWAASTDDVAVAGYEIARGGTVLAIVNGLIFIDQGLSPGTTYGYAVTAIDRAGNRSASAPLSVITSADAQGPTMPTAPPVITARTISSLSLAWSPASDNLAVTGYRVLRGGVLITTVVGTTYTDAGLTPNTSYSYTVQAIDAAANRSTATSAVIGVTLPDLDAPTAPTALVVTPSDGSVAISWTAASDPNSGSGVASYDIYRTGTKVGSSATVTYTDSGLVPATQYTYTVKALDRAGNVSIASVAVVTSTKRDVTAPTVPVVSVTAVTGTSVTLGWPASTDAVGVTGYAIWRGSSCVAQVTTPTWTDASRLPGTSSTYSVKAYDAAGNSSASSSVVPGTTTADATAPTAATLLASTAKTDKTVTLSWTVGIDAVGLAGTEILRDGVVVGLASGTTFVDTGLLPGVSYAYTVRMRDLAGNVSVATAAVPVVTAVDGVAPGAPPLVIATAATVTSVTIAWLAGTDDIAVVGYDIYRDGTKIGSSATLTYADVAPKVGIAASYTVKTKDAAGNASAASPAVVVTAPADVTPPTAPTNLIVQSRSGNTLTLAWNAATDGESGLQDYLVYKDATLIATVTTTTASSGSLTAGTAVSLTVKARDRAGNLSLPSVALPITPSADAVAPTIPTGLASPSKTGTTASLTWTASTDAVAVVGYVVRRGTVIVGRPSTTAFTDTGLKPGTAVSYTVAAFDANLNESAVSSTLSVTPTADADTPTVPGALASSSITDTSVVLTWTAATDSNGISAYQVFKGSTQVATTTALTALVSGLTPATAYSFTVKAVDPVNKTATSTALPVTTLADAVIPAVPQKPVATATSLTSISLQWIASSDDVAVTGYEVYRDATTKVAAVNGSTFVCTDTGLVPKHAYVYTVRCRDDAGNWSAQGAGATISTVTDVVAPPPPTNLVVTSVTDRQVVVGWTASVDPEGTAVSYQVLRGSTVLATVAATTYTDAVGLVPNTSYSYTIKAIDVTANTSTASLPLVVKTGTDAVVPAVPTGVTAGTITTIAVSLTWTAATDDVALAGYYVYRASLRVGYVTTTAFTDTLLTPGTAYSYSVRAVDKAGNVSAASTALPASTLADIAIPSTPGNFRVVSKTASMVSLAWNAATDDSRVASYLVYRSGTLVATVNGTTTSVSGLTQNTAYSFTVKAKDAAGKLSNASSTLAVTTPASVIVSPQATLWVTNTTYNSITFGCLMPIEETGISSAYLKKDLGWAQDLTALPTSFMVTGLAPGESHVYAIVVNDKGGQTITSAPVTAQTLSDVVSPTVPTNLRIAAVESATFTVAWNAATDAGSGVAGYQLSVNGVETGYGAGVLQAQIPQQGPGATMVVSVAALDAAGNRSAPSVPLTWIVPFDSLTPVAPVNVQVLAITQTSMTVSWDAVPGPNTAGYLVQANGEEWTWTTDTYITLTNLIPGNGYWIDVTARKTTGFNSPQGVSTYATTVPDTTPPAAFGPAIAQFIDPRTMVLSWPASTDENGLKGYVLKGYNGDRWLPPDQLSDQVSPGYFYSLCAVDTAGNQTVVTGALPSVGLTDVTPPQAPTEVRVVYSQAIYGGPTQKGRSVILEWPRARDDGFIDHYNFRATSAAGENTSSSNYNEIAYWADVRNFVPYLGVKTLWVDTGLCTGSACTLQVQAVDKAGNSSGWSAPATISLIDSGEDLTPPSKPGVPLVAACDDNYGTIAWSPSTDGETGVDHYLVQVNGLPSLYANPNSNIASISFYDPRYALATSLSITVCAVDKHGNVSVPSDPLVLIPSLTIPNTAPQHVILTSAAGNYHDYHWDPVVRHVVGLVAYQVRNTDNSVSDSYPVNMTNGHFNSTTSPTGLFGSDAAGVTTQTALLPIGSFGFSPLQRPSYSLTAGSFAGDTFFLQQYVGSYDATRVWDTATPSAVVPIIQPLGPLVLDATLTIRVQAMPNAPVNFLSTRSGLFPNGQPAMSLLADATGQASVVVTGAQSGRNPFIVSSPMCSGRLTFVTGRE